MCVCACECFHAFSMGNRMDKNEKSNVKSEQTNKLPKNKKTVNKGRYPI